MDNVPASADPRRMAVAAWAPSQERARFERRVLDAGGDAAVLVVNIMNVTLGRVMDRLVPLASERIATIVRTDDRVSRIGSQQLAVILDARASDLDAIATRIEEEIENSRFHLDGRDYHLHVTATHATAAEAGPDGPLLLALDRNSARVHEVHRRIYHEGPYNGGRGGASASSMDEWAGIVLESCLDPAMFGCEAARLEFEGRVWEDGDIPDRPAEFDIDIEVAQEVRGRMRAWRAGFVVPPAFVASSRAYFSELAERMVAMEAARRDSLTGLPNRAGLQHHVQGATVSSVALVDADHFKSVNDQHGYECGDRVLVELAAILDRFCSPALVARWGGEEFVVAAEADPDWLADRLAEALEHCRDHVRVGERTITFSAGVVPVEDGWEEAVGQADRRLKQAKQHRATITVAGG